MTPVRRALASAAALAGAVGVSMYLWPWTWVSKWVAVGAVAGSALLVHRKGLASALAVRGLWTAVLGISTLALAFGTRWELTPSLLTTGALGAGLLLLGRPDPDPASPFQPIAYRLPLLGAVVLGAANALSLGHQALLTFETTGRLTLAAPLAAALGLAALGLYRLRAWALLLTTATSSAVLGLTLLRWLPVPGLILPAYGAVAALQLGLLAPFLAAFARRLVGHEPSEGPRLRIAPVVPETSAIAAETEVLATEEAVVRTASR